MKFYLCQTEHGPQYVHLQSEAKKIDPNFTVVEEDISKQPLLEMFNELFRLRHAADGGTQGPAVVSRPVPPKPGEIGTFAEGNEPRSDHKWSSTQGDDVRAGRRCDVCETREEIANWQASSMASTEIEDLVLRVTDANHLDNIESMIKEQKDGLKKRK